MDGLLHQRVIRYITLARQIFLTGKLIRKDLGNQILCIHALKLGWYPAAITISLDSQRTGSIPAPAGLKHWRIQERLDQHLSYRRSLQIMKDICYFETVHGAQRNHDTVFISGSL